VRIERSDQRPYAIPFFELLPDSLRSRGSDARTVVRWENYRTEDPIARFVKPDVERTVSPPSESVFQRLGDLRKRWATPRDRPAAPNGSPPESTNVERPGAGTDRPGASPSAAAGRAPILSPPPPAARPEASIDAPRAAAAPT